MRYPPIRTRTSCRRFASTTCSNARRDAVSAIASVSAATAATSSVEVESAREGRSIKPSAIYANLFWLLLPVGQRGRLSHHKVFCAEAEYGFTIGPKPLEPTAIPYTREEVWAAVASYEPCIELCGSRFTTATAKASPYHLLADAMSNALVIRGAPVAAPDEPPSSLVDNTVRILVDGREVSSGTGKENPGDSPLDALTFLVNDLTVRRQQALPAGALVIAGHTCQVAFSSRPAPPSARTLPQAQVCGARVVPQAAVELEHTVLEAYFEGCGTVRATLVE